MKSKVMNQTTTISISRWMGRTFPLLALVAMGLFASCRNEATSEPVQTKTAQEATTSYREGNIDFPLAADFNISFSEETESTLRGISATVSPTLNAKGRHGITLPNELPVLCIIRSSGSDEPTYYEAKAVKTTNGYHIEKERIKLASGSALAPGKKWYVMIAMGGTYDKDAGQMKFGASGPEAAPVATSAGRVMDIPAVSHWMEMPTYPNGHPKWPKDWSQAEKQRKLEVFPQGVLCRATLRLDDAYKQRLGSEQVALKVNTLRIVSTSLSFAGYFSLAKNDLPAVDFKGKSELDRGGANNGNLMKWIPSQTAATKKEFTALNASAPEYEKIFTGDVFSLQGGSSAKIFSDTSVGADVKRNVAPGIPTILFWAIPTTTAGTNLSTTLIAETGTSSNARILEPKHTYIYGKKHPNQVLSGKSVYFDAVYYHPYTPLDYMAEYNVVRKDPDQFVPGGTIPHGTSNQLDTQHGVNSFAMLTYADVKQVNLTSNGRQYTSPNVAQWESIIPFHGVQAVNTVGGRVVNEANVTAQVGSVSGTTKFSSRRVGNVVYALALRNLGGTNKYSVAYRYERVNNPQAPGATWDLYITQMLHSQLVGRRNPPYHMQTPWFASDKKTQTQHDRVAFQIDAIHLGAHFIGSVDDIANENFWSDASLRKERRILPISYTSFVADSKPTFPHRREWNALAKRLGTTYSRIETLYNYYSSYSAPQVIAGKGAPSFYWVGDENVLAMAPEGAKFWINGEGSFNEHMRSVIRFSCRPFTTEEHP